MNRLFLRRAVLLLYTSVTLMALGGVVTPPVLAQTRELRAVGVPLTGPNDRCGEAVWTLNGVPPGPESRGTFLGLENNSPGATDAIPLVAADCAPEADPNRLLATTFDSAFAAVLGWPEVDDRLKNLTLRNIPVPGGNGIRAQIPLPGVTPPNPLPPTITRPTDPISIGSWLSATGDMTIICDDLTQTATVSASMSNLIPNGLYTMWGVWADTNGDVLEVPFGGLPNAIVVGLDGGAEWFRDIDFCPLDFAPDGSELQYISLAYHGDGVCYGTVPYEPFVENIFVGLGGLPFPDTLPGGIVTFNQLGFRVNAVGGPDPDPCIDDDSDGYGDPASPTCTHPEWDCDDTNPNVNPGMTEIPGNQIDDDCDPTTPAYPEPANTIAASYGTRTLTGSQAFNALALLLIPVGGIIFLRLQRRKK